MGVVLNHGWTFYLRINFCIGCTKFNHGWNLESWVTFLTICEICNHGWITTVIYYFAVLISRDQLSFYLCHERTINILSAIMNELLNFLGTFESGVNFELWVNFWIKGKLLNNWWTFDFYVLSYVSWVNFSIMGEYQLWFIIL